MRLSCETPLWGDVYLRLTIFQVSGVYGRFLVGGCGCWQGVDAYMNFHVTPQPKPKQKFTTPHSHTIHTPKLSKPIPNTVLHPQTSPQGPPPLPSHSTTPLKGGVQRRSPSAFSAANTPGPDDSRRCVRWAEMLGQWTAFFDFVPSSKK